MSGTGPQTRAEATLAAIYGDAYPLQGIISDVGRRLRAAREAQGITQRELAAIVQTGQMQIHRVEVGDRLGLSMRSIFKQAEGLGLRMVITFEPIEESARCCQYGCNGGACEVCECCGAGWCVSGTDGSPRDDGGSEEEQANWEARRSELGLA